MEKVAGVLVFFGLWMLVVVQGEVHVRLNERRLVAPINEDYGQSRMYIVHMSHSLAHGGLETAHAKYSQLLQAVKAQDSALPLHVYHSACHGFSAHLTSHEAEALRQVDGVLGVLPDNKISLQTTHTPEFLNLTAVRGVWPEGRFGDDVIIGMIDTGIWPESSSFDDAEMGPVPARWKGICETGQEFNSSHCNKKLIGARSYYAGFERTYNITLNSTSEFMSARDAQGHGTHTASTAAGSAVPNANLFGSANGTARGMAPKARIAVYKACWLFGGCAESDVLAAIDQAVADGVDIISLSLSFPLEPYPQASLGIGAFGAMRSGVFVSCAGGNNGSFGLGTVVTIEPWVMTVAASTVDRTFPANVELGNGQILRGLSLYQLGGGQVAQLITGANATTGNATESAKCLLSSLDPVLVKEKIVVCQTGAITNVEKGAAVLAAGGAGMIVTNTDARGENIRADPHYLPASHVGAAARTTILAYMNATANATAKIQLLGTQLGVKPAPMVASFSSRGPNLLTPQVLKPDIAAPGVDILAAWTGAVGPSSFVELPDTRKVDFNIISGTSMACPHITGLAALLKAAHPDWSPSAIKSAMMTTATIRDNTGGVITDQATSAGANPFLFGSGHVRPERALDPGLVYDMAPQDYVNFLCAVNVSARELLLFTHNETARCPQSPVRVEDMNYPSFSAVFQGAPSSLPVSMNMSRTVTNVGNASATYTAQVFSLAGINITVEPDVLSFGAKDETKRFTVQVTTVNAPDVALEGVSVTSFAYLLWTDGLGVHSVQSPIGVTLYK